MASRSPSPETEPTPARPAPADGDGVCPVCAGIEVLQEKWVLHIVHALLDGPKGFNAIQRGVGGCNPTTLTQRLSRLESLGIVTKRNGNGELHAGDGNRRGCYCLTDTGERLDGVIEAIRRWADGTLTTARPDDRRRGGP